MVPALQSIRLLTQHTLWVSHASLGHLMHNLCLEAFWDNWLIEFFLVCDACTSICLLKDVRAALRRSADQHDS